MGISRDSRHKRRLTGGKRKIHQKKRKFELGRPAAMTKIGHKRVHVVRVRGGNFKYRALRLEAGNFAWPSEAISHKSRIMDVVYNASNNELVRTKTLVKNAIVVIDATPFRSWFQKKYGITITKKSKDDGKKGAKPAAAAPEQPKAKVAANAPKLPESLYEQLAAGRVLAAISSRPGQCGRADGYILEGDELDFYQKKLQKKKSKKA